jgi:hypothetical protein
MVFTSGEHAIDGISRGTPLNNMLTPMSVPTALTALDGHVFQS